MRYPNDTALGINWMNRDSPIIPIQEGEPDALVGQRNANPAQDRATCNEQRNALGITQKSKQMRHFMVIMDIIVKI